MRYSLLAKMFLVLAAICLVSCSVLAQVSKKNDKSLPKFRILTVSDSCHFGNTCMAWSSDSRFLAVSAQSSLRIYDTSKKKMIADTAFLSDITSICFTRNNQVQQLSVAFLDASLDTFSLDPFVKTNHAVCSNTISDLAMTFSGELIDKVKQNDYLKVVSIDWLTGKFVKTFVDLTPLNQEGYKGSYGVFYNNPCSIILLSNRSEKIIFTISTSEKQTIQKLDNPDSRNPTVYLAMALDEKSYLESRNGYSFSLYDIDGNRGKKIVSTPMYLMRKQCYFDGKYLLDLVQDNSYTSLVLVNAATDKVTYFGGYSPNFYRQVLASPDRKMISVLSIGGSFYIAQFDLNALK